MPVALHPSVVTTNSASAYGQRSEEAQPPLVENHWATAYKAPGSKSDYVETDSTTSCHLTLGRVLKLCATVGSSVKTEILIVILNNQVL